MKFVAEKLKECLLAFETLGEGPLAWFDRIFPPETRGDKISHWNHVALPYLITAVVLTTVICFCRCCCGYYRGRGSGGRRLRRMNDSGRNYRSRRDKFERDPRGYLRNIRAHPE
ncbi:hypothetical protein OROGR_014907 [Orobanche gracilis]